MTIALVAALEIEVAPLVDMLQAQRLAALPLGKVYGSRIGVHDVLVVELGMGKVRAAAVLQSVIHHFALDGIVCFGSAGAINPALAVGQMVVAERVTQHDFRLMLTPTLLGDHHTWIETDAGWSQRLLQTGQRLGRTMQAGRIISGDQVIAQSAVRRQLWAEFRADCVEMEGAAIGLVCTMNNIPFTVVRGLTDKADEDETNSFRKHIKSVSESVAAVVAESVRAL